MRCFLLALLISSSALAAEAPPINFECMTEFPTTSFWMGTEGEEVVGGVMHHNGTKFMPIHSGIITGNDLPVLNERALLFSRLGEQLEFRFKRSKCANDGAGVVSCFEGEKVRVGDLEIAPFGMYTGFKKDVSFAGQFEKNYAELALVISEKLYFIAMEYAPGECLWGKTPTLHR